MKKFLQEHLQEKLRTELETISVRTAIASFFLISIYQLATIPAMLHKPSYLWATAGLIASYAARFFLKKFRNLSNREWLWAHLATILMHSVFWSLAFYTVSQSDLKNEELYIITYLVFAGLIAAAAYSLSISKRDFYAFIIPITLTQIGGMLLGDGTWPFKLASVLLLTLFFVFLGEQRRRIEKGWLEQRIQNFELQSIIDAVPGGISVLKGEIYHRVNEYIRNIAPQGVSIIGHAIGSKWSSNPDFVEKIKKFIQSKEKRMQYETQLVARGETRAYLVTAIKSFNDETIISTIDIEELKQIEREMMKQKIKLEHSAKMAALGEMAGGLAHEINNPVAIISGRAQQLMMAIERDKFSREMILKGLEDINQTTQRITRIVRGLRSFSHDNSNEPFQKSSIKDIIEETLTFCEAKFKNNGISILHDADSSLMIECRPTQISQVLLNALNNSYDAICENEVDKWIRMHIRTDSKEIEVRIIDSGPGIPQEIRDKIMQPFFSTKEVGKGTGLGLSISKGIVDSHRGQFYFNYENQNNTELVVILPLKQPVNS